MGTRPLAALCVAAALAASGCADPFIEATTALVDTPDTQGPYQVWTTAVGVRGGDSVELRYQVDDRDERRVSMRRTEDGGDGPGDLFRAGIPGQAPGATIRYHVVVERGGDIVAIDPPDGDAAPFAFSVIP